MAEEKDCTMMARKRGAAIYVRVSTDKQTVENQVRELRQIAERRGWEVVEQYSDAGISGSKCRDDRPGLDQMLKDAQRRRFDVVMAWAIERPNCIRYRGRGVPRCFIGAATWRVPPSFGYSRPICTPRALGLDRNGSCLSCNQLVSATSDFQKLVGPAQARGTSEAPALRQLRAAECS